MKELNAEPIAEELSKVICDLPYVPSETVQGIFMASFVNAKKQVAGNGECKDHHFLHEQRREKRLQQLQKHIPHEHTRPSICSNYPAQTAAASYVYTQNQSCFPLVTSVVGMIIFL